MNRSLARRMQRLHLALIAVVLALAAALPMPAPAADGGTINFLGTSVDVGRLQEAAVAHAREQIAEAVKARQKDLGDRLEGAAKGAGERLYAEFQIWFKVRVYKQLDQDGVKPTEENFELYVKRMASEHPEKVDGFVATYLAAGDPAVQSLVKDLAEGTSQEIVDGLKKLGDDAGKKLKRFQDMVGEVEAEKTPAADAMKKYGFSGPWIEKFKDKEAQFRGFDKRYNAVESVTLLVEAFQTDEPSTKIEKMFGLMGTLGDVAERSKIPIVSLMGQIVAAYGRAASQMLVAVNRLETLLRQREGYCLGTGTHTGRDEREKQYTKQFGSGATVCPIDLSPDIYIDIEHGERVFFYLGDQFLVGDPKGGGLPGLQLASRLIADAATHGFARYAGKAKDVRTLAAVYNTRYPLPGRPAARNGDRQSGLAGLVDEAATVIDGIAGRLEAMENMVRAGDPASCSVDRLDEFLKRETGLDARAFHDAGERLGDLALFYTIGYIERYAGAVPPPAAGGNPLTALRDSLNSLFGKRDAPAASAPRMAAYDTYSKIWEKFETLSLLRVYGRVMAKGASARCTACAGARIVAGVLEARPLPGCEVAAADGRGQFYAYYTTRSDQWTLTLSASGGGQASAGETVNAHNTGVSPVPFVAGANVTLLLPIVDAAAASMPAAGAAAAPPPAADAPAVPGVDARTARAAIVACDFELAGDLVAGVRDARERATLARDLAARRQQHAAFVESLRAAEAEAAGDEPHRALDKLRAAERAAGCDDDRRLAAAAIARVEALLAAMHDEQLIANAEDSIRDCRFRDALRFIDNISPARRGGLETRARDAEAREDSVRNLQTLGRDLLARGSNADGLAKLREARSLSRCPRVIAAIDGEIGRAPAANLSCDGVLSGGVVKRDANGIDRCVCPAGRVANRAQTACIASPDAQVAALNCPANAEGHWSAENEAARCRCRAGFVVGGDKRSCVEPVRDPDLDHLLADVAANSGQASAADHGERTMTRSNQGKAEQADHGPSTMRPQAEAPTLMDGLLAGLTAAVGRTQGLPVPPPADPPRRDPPPAPGRGGSTAAPAAGNSAVPPRKPPAASDPAFVIISSAMPTSDDRYRRHPECRYLIGRGMQFVSDVAGGKHEIAAAAEALRVRGHANVEVRYYDENSTKRLVDEWSATEKRGYDACFDAIRRAGSARQ